MKSILRDNKGRFIKGSHVKTEFKKDMIPWNKGIPYSEEVKLKISKKNKGRICPRGVNSHTWRGGISPLYERIRKHPLYKEWRLMIFGRDNFTCQYCGKRGTYLHCHHKKSFSSILQYYEIITLEEVLECEELWNINNGVTLCKKCHKELHKKLKMENE